ncbi:NAD(P)H-dependent oxidoreductase [Parabacteroides distasonis]|mgnify:FL=1|uniref:NAD(P)H-dependent oxidoreductase n=1 Tax=Bacteroidales TaxID=171549 RepID=UPI001D122DD2|nr:MULTISPECIES: NAD(P)H-dependent oxidoreductase [Bacteroidales]MCC2780577.1 NAD(P)H-dependent oxidoreductase [Parabacteroides distasonis]MCE9070429.1 NAD(P)H-dependent oxidoreductase [Parabacteroides distasonis]MCQ5178903.1 NAD(P)H-dependent oxidoreductase [Parabacteroides distasonis]MCR1999977.1 NAD(P)H-dependent oxidoreductase [Bacteroides acidifaciens]WMI44139.1 NAD(P)H-dependent oxidoreductase [Parabacteroides distasonis]
MNVFIINGGQTFAHSGGMFNNTLTGWTVEVMKEKGFAYRVTNINDAFDPMAEVENFKWADVIIYHTPIWWFQLPNGMKRYIDEVFTAGHDNGIYRNDGRSRKNPDVNYGTGGLMQGKRYMVTTSWNAPQTAFTLEGEFFDRRTVDEGVLFGFHKMNQFVGMTRIEGFHFHDLEKNATPERIAEYHKAYVAHINQVII